MTESKTYTIKKLIYQSNHRGCKELDIILGGFATKNLQFLSDEELAIYEQMCNESEWDIYSWFTGEKQTPTQFLPLIEKIKTFNKSLHSW